MTSDFEGASEGWSHVADMYQKVLKLLGSVLVGSDA